jgi:Ricin-type beta-trefoil lectin domain
VLRRAVLRVTAVLATAVTALLVGPLAGGVAWAVWSDDAWYSTSTTSTAWNLVHLQYAKTNAGGGNVCVDVFHGDFTPDQALGFFGCNTSADGSAQRVLLAGDGTLRMGPLRTYTMCIGSAATPANDTAMIVRTCGAAPSTNFQWDLVAEAGYTKFVSRAVPTQCLDSLNNGGTADYNPIITYTCGANNVNQRWTTPQVP